MRTLIGPISALLLVAVLLGGAATASKSTKKTAAGKNTCVNDFGCKSTEKCVKYTPQAKGFCADNTDGAAFQPAPPKASQPSRSTCSIAAEGQCLK